MNNYNLYRKTQKNKKLPRRFLSIIMMLLLETALLLLFFFLLLFRYWSPQNRLWLSLIFIIFSGSIIFTAQYIIRYLICNIIDIRKKLIDTMDSMGLTMNMKHISYHDNMIFLLEHLHDIREKEYSAELSHKEAELTALQRQINPHFLYNTLDAIRGSAYEEGAEQTAEMIACLSNLFRYITHESGRILTFKQELNNVENYFYIQQFRFENRFTLAEEIDKKDPAVMQCQIPAFTLQPIVENAIYHGLKEVKTDGQVKISALRTQSHLLITISDNGCGMDINKLKKLTYGLSIYQEKGSSSPKDSGIALSNVNARIKLNFGEEYGLSITSTLGNGTSVQILLPLNSSPVPPSCAETA